MEKAGRQSGRRVLIVDDEEAITGLMVELLREFGFEVMSEQDGHEALTAVESFKPDVVVSDLHMPSIDGDELYRRVVAKAPAYANRFIFMSGSELDSRLSNFLGKTGCVILTKPFDVQELAVAINSRVDKSERGKSSGS